MHDIDREKWNKKKKSTKKGTLISKSAPPVARRPEIGWKSRVRTGLLPSCQFIWTVPPFIVFLLRIANELKMKDLVLRVWLWEWRRVKKWRRGGCVWRTDFFLAGNVAPLFHWSPYLQFSFSSSYHNSKTNFICIFYVYICIFFIFT